MNTYNIMYFQKMSFSVENFFKNKFSKSFIGSVKLAYKKKFCVVFFSCTWVTKIDSLFLQLLLRCFIRYTAKLVVVWL